MKPSARRRVERRLQELMGDDCSLCGKPFAHNSKTFGGVTKAGVPAYSCEYCSPRLVEVVLSGVYVKHAYDTLLETNQASPNLLQQEVEEAVNALQRYIANVDAAGEEIARRGGVKTSKTTPPNFRDSAWKANDAAWFKARPDRSHRHRSLFEGETFGSRVGMPDVPLGYVLDILVRQVSPGTRLRIPFARNKDIPVPDVERVIHALFDRFSPGSKPGAVSAKEILEVADKYAPRVTRTN